MQTGGGENEGGEGGYDPRISNGGIGTRTKMSKTQLIATL